MKKINHPASKRYLQAKQQVESGKIYPLNEAIELVKQASTVKFKAGIEAHFNLKINPKKSEEQIRGSITLPNSIGKKTTIAVLAEDSQQQETAKQAGATIVGGPELIEEIKKNRLNFDILIATPEMMRPLAPAAKILGPKGLMPNPKDGSVSKNPAEAVKEFQQGKISYKSDDSGNLHILLGKTSMPTDKIAENFKAFLEDLKKNRPSGLKGEFIQNIHLSSSMGPAVKTAAL